MYCASSTGKDMMNLFIKFSFDLNLIDQNFDLTFDMVPVICRITALYFQNQN